jgi:hypothetical protein
VVNAIAIEKLSKVGVYHGILQDLRQNFIYVYRFFFFISAKEGTAAKDRLFPVELERKDGHAWAPVQRPYVLHILTTYTYRSVCVYRDISPTSYVRVEVQIKSGHLSWAKRVQNDKEIDIKKLFNEYWTSKNHEITVPGQSSFLNSPLISDKEVQRWLSLESIVAPLNYTSLRALRFAALQPRIPSN